MKFGTSEPFSLAAKLSKVVLLLRMIDILVVDDNPADVLLFKEFLSDRYAVRITVAQDGEEALSLLIRPGYKPRLIVLDGQEVLKRIRRKLAPKIPIIVMSGSRNLDDISQAYANGANVYVDKPSELNALRKTIESLARLWVEPLVREEQAGQPR
jgi:two-component system, chemotaxis family, response regulator Rcp1